MKDFLAEELAPPILFIPRTPLIIVEDCLEVFWLSRTDVIVFSILSLVYSTISFKFKDV